MARPKSDKTLEKEKHKLAAQAALDPLVVAADAEARRMRLKTLIMLGKERGYLTYAEITTICRMTCKTVSRLTASLA